MKNFYWLSIIIKKHRSRFNKNITNEFFESFKVEICQNIGFGYAGEKSVEILVSGAKFVKTLTFKKLRFVNFSFLVCKNFGFERPNLSKFLCFISSKIWFPCQQMITPTVINDHQRSLYQFSFWNLSLLRSKFVKRLVFGYAGKKSVEILVSGAKFVKTLTLKKLRFVNFSFFLVFR